MFFFKFTWSMHSRTLPSFFPTMAIALTHSVGWLSSLIISSSSRWASSSLSLSLIDMGTFLAGCTVGEVSSFRCISHSDEVWSKSLRLCTGFTFLNIIFNIEIQARPIHKDASSQLSGGIHIFPRVVLLNLW